MLCLVVNNETIINMIFKFKFIIVGSMFDMMVILAVLDLDSSSIILLGLSLQIVMGAEESLIPDISSGCVLE